MLHRLIALGILPRILGPLFFDGDGAGAAGDAGAGDAGAAGEGDKAGAGAATGDSKKDDGKAAGDSEPMIPKSRFDEVNNERARLAREKEARDKKDLADKGEHEQLAANEKAGREKAERALKGVALRSAFVEAASGKVADVGAAFKLADLSSLDVEIVGDDEDASAEVKGDVAKVVEAVLKAYPFLKPSGTTGAGMGGPNNGAGGAPADTSKLPQSEKLNVGLAEEIAKLSPQKQGAFSRNE